MTAEPFNRVLPLFVYGTLREGGTNAPLVMGRAEFGRVVRVPGFALHANHGQVWPAHEFGFPFAVQAGPGDTIVGQVVTLHEGSAEQAMRDIDRLEAFDPAHPQDGLYVRRTIVLPDTAERAWTYTVGPRFEQQVIELPRIASGDWADLEEV